ncbi:unnamed protein product [Brugia timori]|uniref:PK_Tyr_Ser-Thr domain-containing protein n=1 Tax=Brugia timori TaxID=42155 RepID=A0A0R3RD09_9BILA|nr:unnamed protein product [Brugia timori]
MNSMISLKLTKLSFECVIFLKCLHMNLTQVINGYKMPFPPEAPPWIVEVVHNYCWQLNPDMRANMGQVARRIEQNAGITAPVLITTPVTYSPKLGDSLQPSVLKWKGNEGLEIRKSKIMKKKIKKSKKRKINK